MNTFLDEVAHDIYLNHGKELHRVRLIFANKRAGLFFREKLTKHITGTSFTPEILSLKDYVLQQSCYSEANNILLIHRLYKIFKSIRLADESFDKFFFWGKMLLKDFDELDKFCIDPRLLFLNIKRQKELDFGLSYLDQNQIKLIKQFWENFGEKNAKYHHQFIKIWNILHDVYEAFNASLLKDSLTYEGKMYRMLAQEFESNTRPIDDKQVHFIGFNALNKAEEKILKWFVLNKESKIYWDIDYYYIDKTHNKAGMFFRKYMSDKVFSKTFPQKKKYHFKPSQINTFACPGPVSQVKELGAKLKSLLKEPGLSLDQVLIVLCDEQLLLPTLNSLPESVQKINVTMGVSIKHSSIYALIDGLIRLYENSIITPTQEIEFYYKHVVFLLQHPFVYRLDKGMAHQLMNKIIKYNLVRFKIDELITDNCLKSFFPNITEVSALIAHLQEILHLIHNSDNSKSKLENEFTYTLIQELNQLEEVITKEEVNLDIKGFAKIFSHVAESLSAPFSGEPLEGMQVMGMLETRNLDFDYVFILSVNEDYLPLGNKKGSFIPYNIRKAFELPTINDQDAIYSYIFYRSIQRASHVNLFYVSGRSNEYKGEPSRHILQIKYESGFQFKENILHGELGFSTVKPLSIKTTKTSIELLNPYLIGEKQLSPSAINTYFNCKLQFYFRYAYKLYEQEEIEEDINAMLFGNILHNTMELLYKPHIGKIIDEELLKELLTEVSKNLKLAYKKTLNISEAKEFDYRGQHKVVREAVMSYVQKLLKKDMEYAPFFLHTVEAGKKEGYSLTVKTHKGNKIILGGTLDRVDEKNNLVRVIDYKTGKDNLRFKNMASLFDTEDDKRNKTAFQTLFYAWLFEKKNPHLTQKIKPIVLKVSQLFEDNFDGSLEMGENRKYEKLQDVRSYLTDFENYLTQTLSNIFDGSETFSQTKDEKKCQLCAYKNVCHR